MKWSSIDLEERHIWFAWYPVNISGTTTWIWLEYVQRRWHPYTSKWFYFLLVK